MLEDLRSPLGIAFIRVVKLPIKRNRVSTIVLRAENKKLIRNTIKLFKHQTKSFTLYQPIRIFLSGIDFHLALKQLRCFGRWHAVLQNLDRQSYRSLRFPFFPRLFVSYIWKYVALLSEERASKCHLSNPDRSLFFIISPSFLLSIFYYSSNKKQPIIKTISVIACHVGFHLFWKTSVWQQRFFAYISDMQEL